MKQIEQFLGMRRAVMLTVVTYIAWQLINVIQPWMSAMGAEKFQAIFWHPFDHLYDIVSLLVGLAGAVVGAIRALLNKDLRAVDASESSKPKESKVQ